MGFAPSTRASLRVYAPEVGYLRNTYDPTPDGKAIVAFVETQGSPAIRIRTGWRKW